MLSDSRIVFVLLGLLAFGCVGGGTGLPGDAAVDAAVVDRARPGEPRRDGSLNFTITHGRNLITSVMDTENVIGDLYACLFSEDPFLPRPPEVDPVAHVVAGARYPNVDLELKGSQFDGTRYDGTPPFQNLPAGTNYLLVIWLDDDGDNHRRSCVDLAGKIQISDRDPLYAATTSRIRPSETILVEAVFDHRRRDGIW